jgi:hypothetical protein
MASNRLAIVRIRQTNRLTAGQSRCIYGVDKPLFRFVLLFVDHLYSVPAVPANVPERIVGNPSNSAGCARCSTSDLPPYTRIDEIKILNQNFFYLLRFLNNYWNIWHLWHCIDFIRLFQVPMCRLFHNFVDQVLDHTE